MSNLKLGLSLDDITTFGRQFDHLGAPWSLVHIFQKLVERIILALSFSHDLFSGFHPLLTQFLKLLGLYTKTRAEPTLLSLVFRHHPVTPYSCAFSRAKYLLPVLELDWVFLMCHWRWYNVPEANTWRQSQNVFMSDIELILRDTLIYRQNSP